MLDQAPPEPVRLILASGSRARKNMLTAAGLTFEIVPADIDEDAITSLMISESDCIEAADIARALASEKALAVARAHPSALVIGSDQVLALGRRKLSKAKTIADARETLQALRGQTHELVSAVALASDGELLWQSIEAAQLTMRLFSDDFLERYLTSSGNRILSSVGCYEIEGDGIQLFERIEGDHFTIMGMPLLRLLNELRARAVVLA
ncbi:MAG TPA: Maf family nucleotide pyrophosphatase [Hyphomicrobium sp.]|nr:Maf family nucleotide pyrophosphatase [Hyphomicrobium sp.]